MVGTAIVEPRGAKHAKRYLAPHGPGPTYEGMRLAYFFNGHEVADFRNSLLGEEPRYEDVRIREVELLVAHAVEVWMDPETAALMFVDQGGENRWRIKPW